MLHCLSTYPHNLRVAIQSLLHGFEYRLMLPARDTSFSACRTSRFQRTCLAVGTPVAMYGESILFSGIAPDQILIGGTTVLILVGYVLEILSSEQALGPLVRGLRLRYVSGNVGLMA